VNEIFRLSRAHKLEPSARSLGNSVQFARRNAQQVSIRDTSGAHLHALFRAARQLLARVFQLFRQLERIVARSRAAMVYKESLYLLDSAFQSPRSLTQEVIEGLVEIKDMMMMRDCGEQIKCSSCYRRQQNIDQNN
jgi:hypothetical protein